MMKVNAALAPQGFLYSFLASSFLFATACQSEKPEAPPEPQITPLIEVVLSAEEQDKLTPTQVIESFKAGNERFVSNDLTARDHSKQVREAVFGQFPKAIVLSCVDSRIPVEDILDKGLGDIFVARVAGNFANQDIIGSMEFACQIAGAKVVMVMGHEQCGAVMASIDGVQLGNMGSMLAKLQPAIDATQSFDGEKVSSNSAFVEAVKHNNVSLTVEKIRQMSPLLQQMEESGEIAIVGASYDLASGKLIML